MYRAILSRTMVQKCWFQKCIFSWGRSITKNWFGRYLGAKTNVKVSLMDPGYQNHDEIYNWNRLKDPNIAFNTKHIPGIDKEWESFRNVANIQLLQVHPSFRYSQKFQHNGVCCQVFSVYYQARKLSLAYCGFLCGQTW